MLPFLKRTQEAGASAPVESVKRESDYDFDSLHVAADEILSAIESKDSKALASALRAAFEICDSEPHEEGPHS